MLKRFLPRSLFARAFLMIVLPTILLVLVMSVVFQERWREDAFGRLITGVGRSLLVLRSLDEPAAQKAASILSIEMRRYARTATPPPLPEACRLPTRPDAPAALLRQRLFAALGEPVRVCAPQSDKDRWQIRLTQPPVIDFMVPTRFFLTAKWHFFLVWTVGAALVLCIVSVIFLKQQVRPIVRLAAVADAFGRGQENMPFRPSGAREVRQAGHAFLRMRWRLKRHLQERSFMLTSISHDLRTMLTRLLLATALLPKDPAHKALTDDLQMMHRILDAYLEFAQTHHNTPPELLSMTELLQGVLLRYPQVLLHQQLPNDDIVLWLRADAVRRAFYNVLSNATQWGERIEVTLSQKETMLCIAVDDDGPGIAAQDYDNVLQPFYRSNQARTISPQKSTGLGLGLALVRDVMHTHGGTITLDKSALGGLRVQLCFPLPDA